MTTAWDIVEVVSADSDFLDRESAQRRPPRRVCSNVTLAIVVSVLAVSGADSISTEASQVSITTSIIHRSSAPRLRVVPTSRSGAGGVDFALGRRPEQLAASFQTLFRPVRPSDEAESTYQFD
jgi:hypothetical protein